MRELTILIQEKTGRTCKITEVKTCNLSSSINGLVELIVVADKLEMIEP